MANGEFPALDALFPSTPEDSAKQVPYLDVVNPAKQQPTSSDLVLSPHNEKITNMMALHAAMASNKLNGKGLSTDVLVDKFLAYKDQAQADPNYDSLKRSIIDLRADRDYEGLRSLLDGYINNLESGKARELIGNISGLQQHIEVSKNEKTAFPRAVVDTLEKGLDQHVRDQQIANLTMAQMGADMFEKEGMWSAVVEHLGFLIPDFHKDLSDSMNSGMISAPNVTARFIDHWNGLTAQEKTELMPALKDHLMGAMEGNKRKVQRFLDFLKSNDPSSDIKMASAEEIAFNAPMVAPVVAGIARKTMKMSSNAPKFLKGIGQPEAAGTTNADALADTTATVSKNVGIDREAAVQNALPVKGEQFDSLRYTDNIHGETMKALRAREARLTEMLDSNSPLTAEILKSHEIESLKAAALGRWRTFAEEPASGFNDVLVASEDIRGFNLEVTFGQSRTGVPYQSKKGAQAKLQQLQTDGVISDGVVEAVENGFVIKVKDRVTYSLDDVGEYRGGAVAGPIRAYLSSPSAYMAALEAAPGKAGRMSEAVNSATRAELGKAVYSDVFNKMIQDAVAPLGRVTINPAARKRLKQVDDVLLQGDGYTEIAQNGDLIRGKVYTPDELRFGVDTPAGRVQLDDNQISSYYALRRVADWMYYIKNQNVRNTLQLRGVKKIDVEGKDVIGKPYDTPQGATAALQGRNVQTIWNPDAAGGKGAAVAKSELNFQDLYDKGYRLVQLDEATKIGEAKFKWTIVSNNSIGGLPDRVLNYKVGYVPRIYKDAFYFVKEEIRDTVNGVADQVAGQRTLRMFSSKLEAEAFKKKEQTTRQLVRRTLAGQTDEEILAARGGLAELGYSEDEIRIMLEKSLTGEFSTDDQAIMLLTDRELAPEQLIKESMGSSGGLFTSPRATHDILFGIDAEVPRQYSAFESFQRYVQHVSNYLPRNEWRIAEQQRWLNTAHEMRIVKPTTTDFREALNEIHARPGSKENASMNAAGRWIMDQARIPTKEEEWYSQQIRSFVEWTERPLFGTVPKLPEAARNWTMRIAQNDPFAAARGAAFHALLGWFNPAQLFVQAQGASVAMSLHPESWLSSMRRGSHLVTTVWSNNEAYVKNAALAHGLNADEAVKMWKLFNKTGLKESIKSTADHAAAAQSYGITMNAVRSAAESGLVFYRAGEMFTRTYSFSTAVDQWLRQNAGKTIADIGDKELKEIIDYTNHISLNMTRANRAAWQKGAVSLPTQFMQIQAKWIEAMFPQILGQVNKFPTAVRTKAMLMQLAIYGTAGVPFGNAAYNGLTRLFEDEYGAENVSMETLKYLNGGVWDYALYSMLNADNEFGGRGAIVSGVENTMYELLFQEHALLPGIFGAAGQTGSHFLNGLGRLKPLVANADKVEWSPKELAYVANELGQTLSTWRNASKAYMMYRNNIITDRHGQPLIDKTHEGGFNGATIIGQALGFRPSELRALSSLKDINKARDAAASDIADHIVNLHYNYLGGLVGEVKDPKSVENVQAMMDYYRQVVGDPTEWNRILKNSSDKIKNGNDQRSKQIRNWYMHYSTNLVDKTSLQWSGSGLGPYTNQLLSGKIKPQDTSE